MGGYSHWLSCILLLHESYCARWQYKEYLIALVGGFAGVTLLAGYKVIGKDQALDEIEELKEELKDWKHRHDACEQKHAVLENEVKQLRKMIMEHLKNK